MINIYQELNISTKASFEVCDITEAVGNIIKAADIREGMVTITSLHTTCALSVNENEERLLMDIRNYFLSLAPPDEAYKHNDLHLRDNIPADEPKNAHAHLIAMMIGNSEVLPIHNGKAVLGKYQSILLLEMDGPRDRTCAIQILG